MKIEIVNPKPVEPKPGQVWKHKKDYSTYLAVEQTGGTGKIILYNINNMTYYWSAAGGFGHASAEEFEYLGDLRVTP